jgi:hypothetical protein
MPGGREAEVPQKVEEAERPDRKTWSFGRILRWHMDHDTRPEPVAAQPWRVWEQKKFAEALGGISTKAIRLWFSALTLPPGAAAPLRFRASKLPRLLWLLRAWTGQS